MNIEKFDFFSVADVPALWTGMKRKVHTVFWHCSASDRPEHDSAEVMEAWHLERGFNEIGYHAFLRKDGTMQMGRSWDKTPAAQASYNYGTLAFCLHGLVETKFTEAQLDTMYELSSALDSLEPRLRFRGHREVAAKACPVVDYKRILGLNADGYMSDRGPLVPNEPSGVVRPTLSITDSGPDVRLLQSMLNVRGAKLVEDGHFGRLTYRAVQAFQTAAGLVADGIVGPLTWRALER